MTHVHIPIGISPFNTDLQCAGFLVNIKSRHFTHHGRGQDLGNLIAFFKHDLYLKDYRLQLYETDTTLPEETACEPPEKAPALNKVPAVLIKVDTAPEPRTMNAPCKVPELVMVKATAELVDFEPDADADHAGVPRAENVGALVEPASVQLECVAIVSARRVPLVVTTVPPVTVVIVKPVPTKITNVVPVVPACGVKVPFNALMFAPVPAALAIVTGVSSGLRPCDAAVTKVARPVVELYEVSDARVVDRLVQLTELIKPM